MLYPHNWDKTVVSDFSSRLKYIFQVNSEGANSYKETY